MRGTAFSPYVAGNTIQALRATRAQGVRYAEIDLILSKDEELITAHERTLNNCGLVDRLTSSQLQGCRVLGGLKVATLPQALSIPFDTLFLDLKDTKPGNERALAAVETAARAVVAKGRQDSAVLMLYATDPSLLAVLKKRGLRGGLKGYPDSSQATRRLVDQAAQADLELLCVNAEHVTPDLVSYAAGRGIWHLPWSTKPSQAGAWADLARAGAGGLIVLHYDIAKRRALPHWQPLPQKTL